MVLKGNREAIAGTGAIVLAFTGVLYLITDLVFTTQAAIGVALLFFALPARRLWGIALYRKTRAAFPLFCLGLTWACRTALPAASVAYARLPPTSGRINNQVTPAATTDATFTNPSHSPPNILDEQPTLDPFHQSWDAARGG